MKNFLEFFFKKGDCKNNKGGLWENDEIFFGKFYTENRGRCQTPPFMTVGRWVK